LVQSLRILLGTLLSSLFVYHASTWDALSRLNNETPERWVGIAIFIPCFSWKMSCWMLKFQRTCLRWTGIINLPNLVFLGFVTGYMGFQTWIIVPVLCENDTFRSTLIWSAVFLAGVKYNDIQNYVNDRILVVVEEKAKLIIQERHTPKPTAYESRCL